MRQIVRSKIRPSRQRVLAVDRVDLEVGRGELFGLLGPNGAGKTTLVKLLCTLLLPTSGRAWVGGYDVVKEPGKVRQRLGVVLGGERALYWRLTGRENLWFFSQLYNIPRRRAQRRIDELLELVGLRDRGNDRVENYSKGMKQRLHLARGLLNEPEILILDEPSIGLDPVAARDLRKLVRSLSREHGRTVLFTTHYMFEAEELADRVGIIMRGGLIALDSPESLRKGMRGRTALKVEVQDPRPELEPSLRSLEGALEVARVGSDPERGSVTYRIVADRPEELTPAVPRLVHSTGGLLLSLEVQVPSLEDVFIEMTGGTVGE